MIRDVVAIAGILLAGACANSPELTKERHPVFKSYDSAKSPEEVVKCLQSELIGVSTELGEGEWTVVSRNQLGTIVLAWYVKPSAGGSRIEVRRAQSIAGGISKAESCY